MKRSRSALKVENGIDFPVLGCSGELIRYSLIASSSTREGLQGLWCPLPVLLLCSIEASPLAQPLQTPWSEGFTFWPRGPAQRGQRQVMRGQKRPWRARLLALVCVSRGQTIAPALDPYPRQSLLPLDTQVSPQHGTPFLQESRAMKRKSKPDPGARSRQWKQKLW